HGGEGADFLEDLPRPVATADAHHDIGLVNVDAGATRIEGVHGRLPVGFDPGRHRKTSSLLYVLPAETGATVSGSWRCPGQTLSRADRTKRFRRPWPGEEASQRSVAGDQPIFMVSGCRTAAWRL